jgi:Lrp/AsnC family transcriptional regulator for asnA, asnC and gidA
MALFGVKVRPGAMESVCEAVTALPETSYVAATAGSFDVIVEVICRDTAHVTELLTTRLHLVDGIVATESFLVLEIHQILDSNEQGKQMRCRDFAVLTSE